MTMQDDGTVSFQPMFVSTYFSWPEKLYGLGILALLVFVLVRDVQLMYRLWVLRRMNRLSPPQSRSWQDIWKESLQRALALERLSIFTFFVSLLVTSMSITNTLSSLQFEKSVGIGYVLFDLSQKPPEFSMGMLVCSLLYGSGFFFESRLNRRKLRFEAVAGAALPREDLAQPTN